MYFNILKKDLKRKKTMNIILLLFIILATTFVSSSVNNMIAVTTALDSYFEKAGMDGLAVCREIRETSNAPIIIVSAKTEKDDKLNGLYSVLMTTLKSLMTLIFCLQRFTVFSNADIRHRSSPTGILKLTKQSVLLTKKMNRLTLLRKNLICLHYLWKIQERR